MDEQAIKDLIATSLEELLAPIIPQLQQGIKDAIDAEVSPRLTALEDVATTPKAAKADKADKAANPLEERLALLEKQLADRDQALKAASFDSALNSALDQYPTQFKDYAKKLLKSDLVEASEKDGQWYTKDGKKLNESVNDFFSTDFGKHLLPAETPSGAGVTPPTSKVPANTQPSLDSIIQQAFLS